MHRRHLSRRAAAHSGVLVAAALVLAALNGPLATHAKVGPPQGIRVLIEEAPPQCGSGFCYSPADADVGRGATVTWFNNTGAAHTVTRCTPAACGGQGPGDGADVLGDSGQFANGASWFFTFRSPGRYAYYCTVDGYKVMHGSVTVHDTGPQSTPTPAQPFGVPLPALPPLPYIPVPVPGVGAGHPSGSTPHALRAF
ncbi:MAG TPA: plastocyanin/azurin family copper-binding protein [Candidatus Dormibacteraeota bacterium]|jgi:plastocyanin|nr:plastocyanin/azurin family copper-binding protein [Candidatus Dormibacteraeota bacterium]